MALAYDITRLVTRVFNTTPNGIDRIDYALAEHCLGRSEGDQFGVIAAGLRPELVSRDAALAAAQGIGAHWGELSELSEDPGYQSVVFHLTGTRMTPLSKADSAPRIVAGRSGRVRGVLGWIAKYGLPIGQAPRKHLPNSSLYLNVSQFPLWVPGYFEWLEDRRDIKSVFFIHDLLPLEMPEYFPRGEYARHHRRLANLARFGTAALVTSKAVKDALSGYLHDLGRGDMPIFVGPVPASLVFSTPKVRDPRLAQHQYFVCCGTLEPRKNHLMLLHVWRELVRRTGKDAPRLVLVGARGWKYDPIIDLLEGSPALRDNVIEVAGLTSPALKCLLDNACALLMPSFAEGYGLPVREALAGGAPVIASDIPAFREITDSNLHLISPLDGEAWLTAICAFSASSTDDSGPQSEPRKETMPAPMADVLIEDPNAVTSAGPQSMVSHAETGSLDLSRHSSQWANYFADLDAFMGAL